MFTVFHWQRLQSIPGLRRTKDVAYSPHYIKPSMHWRGGGKGEQCPAARDGSDGAPECQWVVGSGDMNGEVWWHLFT